MATVNKDFKIKSGLIVEGTTATVNGYDILTKKPADDQYIIGLIGGSATSDATPDTVVLRDENADFAAHYVTADLFIGDLDGQAATVDSLSGHTTTEISEGTNLYFTNQRALDATSAAYDVAGSASTAYTNAVADANDHTDSSISTEVSNRNDAISTAKGEAISSSNGYTDSAISTEVTNRNSAISTAKGEAISDANDYTDSAISTEVSDRNSAISTAITNLDLANTYDAKGDAAQALADAQDYTDQEVAALVDSAPDLLNTLNELAAAIADNPNYATDAASAVAGRVAKSGDTMTGALVLPGAPTLDLQASTKKYVDDQAYLADMSARGYADTSAGNAYDNALADANSYTDSSITNLNLGSTYDAFGAAGQAYTDAVNDAAFDASTKANQAESNANDYTDSAISTEVSNRNSAITDAVNSLTTSDIEEGSNLYFTDSRAKSSAADLLTGASLTNITITGTGAGLTITAENGVADSTTDDLAEGETNLYFTNGRALDAVDNSYITPASVSINNYRKEEATQQYVASASTVDVHSIGYPYESAKYLVRVVGWVGGVKHSQISEILMTVDGNDNIAITEYGTICTDTNPLASFSARLDQTGSTRYALTATTAVSGCEVIAAATMLSWAD